MVLIALVVVGQLAKSKKAYPFMPLRMYGAEATGPVELLLYEAELQDGRVERFRPSLVIAELGAARIVRGLHKRLSGLPATGQVVDDRELTPPQRLGVDVLRRLMRKHNQLQVSLGQPARQARQVRVYRVRRPPPYTKTSETRTLLARVGPESP